MQRIWEAHMQPAIAPNPGHVTYVYTFDDTEPDVIRVFQQYSSKEASESFLHGPWYAAYLEAVEPLLLGEPELHVVTVCWTKSASSG